MADETGNETELFYPRRQRWSEHFAWRGYEIVAAPLPH
jgi:hypothetical protein